MNAWRCAVSGVLAALAITSSGYGGNDPLTILGDGTQIPTGIMSLPLSASLSSFEPFSSSQGYFVLNGVGGYFTSTTPVKAPSAGVVTATDVSASSITIAHSARVVSQVIGVTPSVVAGNYVTAESQIGVTSTVLNQIKFAIYVDGVAVCPLSFLSSTARTQLINTWSYGSNPCRP